MSLQLICHVPAFDFELGWRSVFSSEQLRKHCAYSENTPCRVKICGDNGMVDIVRLVELEFWSLFSSDCVLFVGLQVVDIDSSNVNETVRKMYSTLQNVYRAM